jgi:predicted nucleic acid-binding Zn ribbon protein
MTTKQPKFRGPEPIGNILAELMARQGFARVQSTAALETAWREAAGELIGRHTRIGAIRRGKLEVTVAHSALVQELTFQKPALLAALARSVPDEKIKDLRFRVGPVE